MKKLKVVIVAILLAFITLNIGYTKAYAEDDGYYIKNMKVDVVVNDKRQYFITETIDVFFNEDRHGIKRNIPVETSTEEYSVTDITVEGAPFEREAGRDVNLKIGDEDEEISGDKRYVIRYTLNHYNDEQDEGDYIYLNLMPSWDTRVENFEANITYPKEGKLESINLTDGKYGSRENNLTKYSLSDNNINIKSTGKIGENSNVTVNARLNEGTFKNAPLKTYPITINKDIMNVEITKEKEYKIEREFQVSVNEEGSVNYIYLWNTDSRDKLTSLSIDNDLIKGNIKNYSVKLPSKVGTYNFKVTYTMRPTLNSKSLLEPMDTLRMGKTESFIVNIKSSVPIDGYKVDFKERGVNSGKERYTIEKKDGLLTFKTLNTVYPKEKINISLESDNSLFKRDTSNSVKVNMLLASMVGLLVVILYFIFRDKKRYASPIEFYPPEGMSSAELGFAYKEYSSTKDITSLIFYWASHGHLKIKFNKNDEFTLIKENELDSEHKSYERKLFRALFKKGNGNEVSEVKLRNGALANDIAVATKDIYDLFKGDRKLTSAKSRFISFIGLLLSFIPIVLFAISTIEWNNSDVGDIVLISIIGMAQLSLVYIILYLINAFNHDRKFGVGSFIGLVVIILIYGVGVFIEGSILEAPFIFIIVAIISTLLPVVLSAALPKRSDYGHEVLEKIIGFKNFIEVSEKPRLEALLKDDPEYFYKTLPYVQVLNVTNLWIDKFKDIEMVKPSYYDGYNNLTTYYIISRLSRDMNSISSTANSSNVSSSDGGGFSGGGFSGGGSGGGGGSSW